MIAPTDAVAARLRADPAAASATRPTGLRCPADAPAPGWAPLLAIAHAAARAAEPPGAFACEARDGRLAWRAVRGSPAFRDLLCLLEELSGALCEVCGGPGCARERWGGWVRTLCPRHAVEIAAAGPRFDDVYAEGWRALARDDAGPDPSAAPHDRPPAR